MGRGVSKDFVKVVVKRAVPPKYESLKETKARIRRQEKKEAAAALAAQTIPQRSPSAAEVKPLPPNHSAPSDGVVSESTAAYSEEEKAWLSGNLDYLLDENQRGLKREILASQQPIYVVSASRQIGKSFLWCVLAIEYAISHPRAQIKYAAPTAKMVRAIIRPHMRDIFAKCPKSLKGQFYPYERFQDGVWDFPNQAEITVAGCDNGNADRLRGQHLDVGLVDEGGFFEDLKYAINDVLKPQTINTRGRIIVASSPAKSPSHYFKTLCDMAEERGALSHRTIYENPRLTREDIERLKEDAGGEMSTTWRREYLSEDVTDSASAVIPEATEATLRELELPKNEALFTPPLPGVGTGIAGEWRDQFFDAYTGVGRGVAPNKTGVLFLTWNHQKQTLVVESDLLLPQMTTDEIGRAILKEEERLWGAKRPRLRVSGLDAAMLRAMGKRAGVHCLAASKRDIDEIAEVDFVRALVGRKIEPRMPVGVVPSLRIHPRCKDLRRQLAYAIWDDNRKDFEFNDRDGRYDLVRALMHIAKRVNFSHNPRPVDAGLDPTSMFINPDFEKENPSSVSAKALRRHLRSV